jgi:hypothetical protein
VTPLKKRNDDQAKHSSEQYKRIANSKGNKALHRTVRGNDKSEFSLSKRITNLLFAGTVLAGSMFSIPATAGFADAQSLNDNGFPVLNSTSEYGHGAKGGGSSRKESSADFSPPSADSEGKYPSLAEYIGKLFCTACGKHCPLTAPQCGIGSSQYQQAAMLYENTVSSASVQSSNLTDKTDVNTTLDHSQSDNSDEALQNFLSGLICTGCGRHCPLTALQCSRGNVYLEQAKVDFAAQQGAESTAQTTNLQADQKNAESYLLENVMEYAPFGGLMVGGVFYSIELLKKKKASNDSPDNLWR